MAKAILLTEDDHAILKEILGQYVQERENVLSNGFGSFLNSSPEVHVVYPVDSTGIPARDGIEVGHALCSFCKIVSIAGTPTLATTPTKRMVYNLGTSALLQTYLTAQRDAAGNWLAIPNQSHTLVAMGTLKEALLATDVTAVIENINSHDGTDLTPFLDVSNAMEVQNTFDWYGPIGHIAMVVRWNVDDTFHLIQLKCPPT